MPVLSTDDVARRVADPTGPRDVLLLDARSGERFRGEVEPIDRVAGHVPGARSCPTTAVQDGLGRLLPPEGLARALEPAGAVAPGPGTTGPSVGASCGSGVSACLLVLALEVVGVPAALYPGSWSAWVADGTRAVATGPA